MPENLTIGDVEIDAVARDLGIDVSDNERRSVLRETHTCDVQACPGGGKTTLLVAKLSLLTDKWVWRDRGICVLSHTNAARQEVERLLPAHGSAGQLLSCPHFIGTIQTFVDQFFALPQLRDEGIDVTAVDNDRFASAALRSFEAPCYATARNYLQRKGGSEPVVTCLTFQGHNLDVICPGRKLPDPKTPTFKQLVRLKERLRHEGIFRYDDLYAYAEHRVQACPLLIAAVRHRFPWVFIDEMQDTNSLQESLLQVLFGGGVILQRFGDANQAIFGGDQEQSGQSSFPRQSGGLVLTVKRSKRFGSQIASFASRLAVVQPEILEGRPHAPDCRHTVFTFDEDSIGAVLPAFGRLVLEEFHDCSTDGRKFKAVGYRKKPEEPDKRRLPHSIGDYWSEFDPVGPGSSRHFEHFIDYVRAARRSLGQNGECAEPYRALLSASLSLLHRAGARTPDNKRFSRKTLLDALGKARSKDSFCDVMRALCLDDTVRDDARWKTYSDRIVALVAPILEAPGTTGIGDFIGWAASGASGRRTEPESSNRGTNCYRCKHNGRAVSIEVTTIHAVKGQTHTGTLLLETFWKKHDLGDACDWLADGGKHTKTKLGIERRERLKRLYVAATRPTELLCLAVHRDRLPPCVSYNLKSEGWSIVDLT